MAIHSKYHVLYKWSWGRKWLIKITGATEDGKWPKAIFLPPRWFPFMVSPLIAHTQANAALQEDYGQDVATQAASGVEPCAPGAPGEGH